MKHFSLAILLSALMLVSAQSVQAAVVCQPIYGGGQTCVQTAITLDKKVEHPVQKGVFMDNLLITHDKFAPDQTITFKITLTNTGNTNLAKVTVKDVLPKEVEFVSGAGSYNANTRTLTYDELDLKAGESRSRVITGKIVSTEKLPSDQMTMCEIPNTAVAILDGEIVDHARFCIQKQVAPTSAVTKGGKKVFPAPQVKTTPSTGPEALALAGLIPTGLFGYFLRKKSLS